MNTITNTTIDTVKPNGHILVAGFECNATGLTATSSLTEDQWNLAGEQLANVEARLMWYIGDWLIAGEDHGYLPRGRLQDACDRFGISYSTATNAANTCRSVSESSRRRELSYSHHQEIANRDDFDHLTEWALETNASRDELRAEKRRRSAAVRIEDFGDAGRLPEGAYGVIYADPPWRYEHSKTDCRRIENQYPTMDLEDICQIDIPSADDCILFLWVTSPKVVESTKVIESWGFEYRTCLVWIKDRIGMGYYARQRHELLFVATIGSPPVPLPATRPDSVIEAPRQEHSRKPDCVYEYIETMYPHAKKLEMFSRRPREDWDAWGNEAATQTIAVV